MRQRGPTSGRGEPDVLELRVHGIANTPPAAMLGVRPDQVTQVGGDELGSYWRVTDGAQDRHPAPRGVRREAYSWGAMARLSAVPGLGRVSGFAAGVIRALWVLIVPFGFANVAYWSVDLDEPTGRRSSASGGLVRLFGLVLTMLWVATAATVTLWVVAAQCYGPRTPLPGGGSYVLTCAALPGWLDSWARWTVGTRTAALAALAAVAVLALAAVGSTGRLRYERRMSTTKARGLATRAPTPRWPMLARPGFWTRSTRSAVLWFQHLTVAFALLAGVLAWHFGYRDRPGCRAATGFGASGCLGGVVGRGPWAWIVLGAVALTGWTAWRVARLRLDPLPSSGGRDGTRAADRVSRVPEGVAFGLAVALFAWCEAAVARTGDGPLVAAGARVPFVGLEALPRMLTAVLLLLAVVAVGLRARVPAVVWVPCVLVAPLGAVAAVLWPDGASAVAGWAVAGVAAGALVVVVAAADARLAGRANLGWGGRGPFAFLSLAAGLAMLLHAATVLGVVSWLSRPGAPENAALAPDVAAALAHADAADRLRRPVPVEMPQTMELVTPPGYVQFAVASVGVLALLVLVVLLLTARMATLGRRPLPDRPGERGRPAASRVAEAVQRGRHRAALAQRVERIVGVLAWLFAAALVATLVLPDPRRAAGGLAGDVWRFGVQWSTTAVVTGVGVLVASVVLAGSATPLARPWGLLWDLMCFLPRAAHPFGPPCYTERVVPELRSRIDSWLGDDGGGPVPRDRRVVLSAHSLGGVVAVATLLARWDGRHGPWDGRVGLLTYGTQLRAYFGRFFPELFGPGVLGTSPTLGSTFWAADPWRPSPPGPAPGGVTLVDSLTGPGGRVRWRSLWRRTDFIGFPVDDYAPTPRDIDHAADEVDRDAYLLRVATHGDYPAAPQYREQLDVLVRLLRASR